MLALLLLCELTVSSVRRWGRLLRTPIAVRVRKKREIASRLMVCAGVENFNLSVFKVGRT
jgi:hypothetical protein